MGVVGLPYGLALAEAGRPLAGGLGHALAVGGRPCMGAGRGWLPLLLAAFTVKTQQEHGDHISLYFQIRMERMKEVKRPPL
ncbi:hypothetical protein BHE74_00038097 [Ensete ventricosum]|nr:hypothetical protein BHE74_00038097 [Ensete ventricosum]